VKLFAPAVRLFLLALLLCLPLSAHHSFASFDMQKNATIAGTVKEFQWVNPHCWIQIMVPDSSSGAVEWSVEMSAPSSLLRRGWKPRTLKPGDSITVVLHPLSDGRRGGSFVSAKLADGTVLGGSPTGDAAPERKQ
jgi:Family of unknown function (DUF6152)